MGNSIEYRSRKGNRPATAQKEKKDGKMCYSWWFEGGSGVEEQDIDVVQ